MRKILAALAVALFAIGAAAQTSAPHKATLNWTNSPDTPNTTVSRQFGACATTPPSSIPSTATMLTSSPVTTGTFTDTTVSGGQLYCYFVAAVLNGVQSPPLQVQAVIPLASAAALSVVTQ